MKKISFLILSLFFCAAAALSQTAKEDIYSNVNRAGGGYLAYPVKTSQNTPPPAGYVPFYVSHYGRHGSRYLISDKDYFLPHNILCRADSLGMLTERGKSVKLKLDTISEMCRGRGGDLSSVGVCQQKGIAARMYRAFPEIFEGEIEISARSTLAPRCILSMDAFCESLKEFNPKLQITREASERYLDYLNYHSPQSQEFTSEKSAWRKKYNEFKDRQTHPGRLMRLLFKDENYLDRKQKSDLMWGLYWVAVDMQDIPTDISFYNLFTKEELYDMWQVPNLRYYIVDGNYAPSNHMLLDNAKGLITNIVESADDVIKTNSRSATFRFGHDGNLIPLAGLLGLEGCYASTDNFDKVKDLFCDFRISPMAANIQVIFFRNGKNPDDVIVKFMLNERETSIPIPTKQYPFYKWTDVRNYFQKLIKFGASGR